MKKIYSVLFIAFIAYANEISLKIVGGNSAFSPTQFPGISHILVGDSLCGATIISTQWALTAAHCVYDKSPRDITLFYNTLYLSKGETTQVTKIIVHPGFDIDTVSNDIALLHLKDKVASNIASFASFDVNPGTMVYVAGWGLTQPDDINSLPTVLQYAGVPIVSNENCKQVYGDLINDNEVCAGYDEGGVDACQGDSGGPLYARDKYGRLKLFGITSYGRGCAEPYGYGVYTKVKPYLPWIELYTSDTNNTYVMTNVYVGWNLKGTNCTIEQSQIGSFFRNVQYVYKYDNTLNAYIKVYANGNTYSDIKAYEGFWVYSSSETNIKLPVCSQE